MTVIFNKADPWNLFLKDIVDRMSVHVNLISFSGDHVWVGELEE